MSDLYFSTKSPVENGTTSYDYNYDGDNFTIITLCEEEHDFGTLTTALFTLVFVLSMTGNVLVLCVITKYEDMKKVTNIFILNLAVSDLLFAFSLPFWAVYHSYQWIFGDFMCKLMSGSYFIGFHSSLIFLMAITVERYLTVVHGGSRMLKKRTLYAQVACVVIWLISIATSVKEMMVSVTVETNGTITCEEEGTSSNQVNRSGK
ncbi:CCR3 protein, partial [Amia calva]|nr:CCR3 protein [Amia calva]